MLEVSHPGHPLSGSCSSVKRSLRCSEVKVVPSAFDGVRRVAIQAGERALAEHALCMLKDVEFCSMALEKGSGCDWF